MPIKLSIIVPVYNGEEFLAACVESIRRQTISEWELLLIDDGSADGSGRMCDGYAAADSRIRAIHKKNEGVSAARNDGLKLARGEYIGFVDADDWILPDMYERLLDRAETTGSDMVMCDATTVYDDGREEPDTIRQLPGSAVLCKEQFRPDLLLEVAGSVCRCIYRAELVHRLNLCFPAGIHFSEDRIFNLYAMGCAGDLAYLKEPYYMRRVNSASAVYRFHPDYFEKVKKASAETQRALDAAWSGAPEYKTAYQRQMVVGALAAVNNYYYRTSPWSSREKRAAVRRLCRDSDLRAAIQATGYGGVRGKWILAGRAGLLSLCARYLNWKYGR